jgi:outer membrane protein, heavy metal efflux system
MSDCCLRIFLLLLSGAGWLSAEGNKGFALSFEGAVQNALLNNRELRAARYVVEQARGRLVQSGRWANPEIQVAGMSDFVFGNKGEAAFSVGIYQMFPVTSRLALSRQIGRLDVERAHREIRDQERLLIERVQTQYIRTVAARDRAEKWKEIGRQRREMEAAAIRRIEAGQGSPSELALAASEIATVWNNQSEAEIAAVSDLIELKTLLGYPAEHPLRLTDSVSGIIKKLSALTGDRPKVLHRPDADLLLLEADRAELEIRLARAEAWEGIRIGVEYTNDRGVDAPEGLGTDQFLGVSISVPLPFWNSNQGSVEEKQALRDEMQGRLDALRLELGNDLAKAIQQVDRLQQRATEVQSRGVNVSRQAVEEVSKGFGEGRVDLRDLLTVRSQLAELELAGNASRADLALAYAKLLSTTGAHPAVAPVPNQETTSKR